MAPLVEAAKAGVDWASEEMAVVDLEVEMGAGAMAEVAVEKDTECARLRRCEPLSSASHRPHSLQCTHAPKATAQRILASSRQCALDSSSSWRRGRADERQSLAHREKSLSHARLCQQGHRT